MTQTTKKASESIFETEQGLIYYALSASFTCVMDALDEGIELDNKQRAALAGIVFNQMRDIAQVTAYEAKVGNSATWENEDVEAPKLKKMWAKEKDEIVKKLGEIIGLVIDEKSTFDNPFVDNDDAEIELKPGSKSVDNRVKEAKAKKEKEDEA